MLRCPPRQTASAEPEAEFGPGHSTELRTAVRLVVHVETEELISPASKPEQKIRIIATTRLLRKNSVDMDEDEFFRRRDSRSRRPQRMSMTTPDLRSPQIPELPGDAQMLGPGYFAARDATIDRCFYIGIDFGTT
jgi:hypothetical protein